MTPDQLNAVVNSYRAFVENIARSNVPLHLVGDAVLWTGWRIEPSVENAVLHISPSSSAFMDWCEADDLGIVIEITPEVLASISSNMAFYACYMDVIMYRARAHEINCPTHTSN